MHSAMYWFSMGFMASEASDLLVVVAFLVAIIVIVRYYPHKIYQFQGVADSFFMIFLKPGARIHARNAADVYNERENEDENPEEDNEEADGTEEEQDHSAGVYDPPDLSYP